MTEAFRPDIEAVFEHYGATILQRGTQWQKATCPLTSHEDNSPSASVNVDAGKWNCFSCDTRGDVFDVIGANENVGWADAVKFAKDNFADGHREVRSERRSSSLVPGRARSHSGSGHFVPAWRRL